MKRRFVILSVSAGGFGGPVLEKVSHIELKRDYVLCVDTKKLRTNGQTNMILDIIVFTLLCRKRVTEFLF